MARRHEDWNVGLAEDLRDPEFAQPNCRPAVRPFA
jgi:hypothetical protein